MLSKLYLTIGLGLLTVGHRTQLPDQATITLHSTTLASNESPPRTQRPALNFVMYAPACKPVRSEHDLKARQAIIDQLKKQLAAESPLLVPLNDPQPPRSLAAADQTYRRFVLTHRNSLILPLFQQRYARALLIDYGMLHTRNWPAIAYYTDQLLRGQSLDYPLITSALVNLKGHLPARAYTALLHRATTAAETEWRRQRQRINALTQLARADAPQSRRQRVSRTLLRQGIAHLSADCIGPEVATLHQLAKSS